MRAADKAAEVMRGAFPELGAPAYLISPSSGTVRLRYVEPQSGRVVSVRSVRAAFRAARRRLEATA